MRAREAAEEGPWGGGGGGGWESGEGVSLSTHTYHT